MPIGCLFTPRLKAPYRNGVGALFHLPIVRHGKVPPNRLVRDGIRYSNGDHRRSTRASEQETGDCDKVE